MTRRLAIALALLTGSGLAASPARAQVVGFQGVYVPPSGGRLTSWGISSDVGFMFAAGRIAIWPAIGGEYQRQHDNGPGRSRFSADFRFLTARPQFKLVPFVGGSISGNQSGGQQSEWPGTRTGFDALAGFLFVHDERSHIGWSVQERWGYVDGQPHAFGTEGGIRVGWE